MQGPEREQECLGRPRSGRPGLHFLTMQTQNAKSLGPWSPCSTAISPLFLCALVCSVHHRVPCVCVLRTAAHARARVASTSSSSRGNVFAQTDSGAREGTEERATHYRPHY